MLGGRKYEPKFGLIVVPWVATPSLVTGDFTYEALLVGRWKQRIPELSTDGLMNGRNFVMGRFATPLEDSYYPLDPISFVEPIIAQNGWKDRIDERNAWMQMNE